MPRSGTGVYTLPVAPFTANTVIKSADVNSDLSDIGTALTLSLATTGVSSMTGPIKAFAGSQSLPGYAFAGALSTGFFLSAANEISLVNNGVVTAVFSASTTVTWNGQQIYASSAAFNGGINVGNNAIITTTSAEFTSPLTLDLQASDPVTVAAGKLAIYVKANGFSTTPSPYFETSAGAPIPLMFTGGQCQLTKSGTSLLLLPYGGNRLTVNGIPCIIPDAGISLAASNSAGVFVYIYAAAAAGVVISLVMSTTAPTAQAGTGVKQMTGDATKTLVGAAYTDTGGAWADTNGKLWVLSYFNRRRKASKTNITASLNSSSTTYVEVDSGMRNSFISWVDETVFIDSKLEVNNAAAANIVQIANQHNLDGTTGLDSVFYGYATNAAASFIPNHSQTVGATENTNHYVSIYYRNLAGSVGVCGIGPSAGESTALYLSVNG